MELFKQKYVFDITTTNVILPFINTILINNIFIIGFKFLVDYSC
jgi:hypothetical protein